MDYRPTGNDGVALNNKYNPNGLDNCVAKCQSLAPGNWKFVGTADDQCCMPCLHPLNL